MNIQKMIRWLAWSLILASTVAMISYASQDEPKTDPKPAPTKTESKYVPTPEQAKDLRIDQLEALNVQQTYAQKAQQLPEYQQFQTAVNKLAADCAKVIKDNKWPGDVGCDMNSNPIQFKVNVQVPQTTPEPKPPQPVNGTKPDKPKS